MIFILTIRLLDIPMTDDVYTKKLLLNGAKDLVREHQSLFTERGLNIELFHNKEIRYSAIQIGCYQQAPEWTAIGKHAVKILGIWYELFKKGTNLPLQNTIEIKEHYTPTFLNYQKKYRIDTLLISDDIAKELNEVTNQYARFDRIEKYLFGNLQRFFKHIAFNYDRNSHFLKISLIDLKAHSSAKLVFHEQKKTAFSVIFKCNFRLPQTLRLGQATALGYGLTTHI